MEWAVHRGHPFLRTHFNPLPLRLQHAGRMLLVWTALTALLLNVDVQHCSCNAAELCDRTMLLTEQTNVASWSSNEVRIWLAQSGIPAQMLANFDRISGSELLLLTEKDLQEFSGFAPARARALWRALHGNAAETKENAGARVGTENDAVVPSILDAGQRIVVFKENPGFGWGNQVRGMMYVILYAVLTNRRPVMHPNNKYHRYFEFPAKGSQPTSTVGGRVLNTDHCGKQPVDCLRYENSVIVHQSGVTMDYPFYQNAEIKAQIKKHFGSDNIAKVTYSILRWLFQHPKPSFTAAADNYMDSLQLGESFVVFQLRSWFDVGSKFNQANIAKYSGLLVEQFNIWHDNITSTSGPCTIYVTSDSKEGVAGLSSALAGNPRVRKIQFLGKFEHTGRSPSTSSKSSISSAMIDWYLMGHKAVDAVFCSGTTFCYSAIARVMSPPVRCFTHGRWPEDKKGNWRDYPGEFDWINKGGILVW